MHCNWFETQCETCKLSKKSNVFSFQSGNTLFQSLILSQLFHPQSLLYTQRLQFYSQLWIWSKFEWYLSWNMICLDAFPVQLYLYFISIQSNYIFHYSSLLSIRIFENIDYFSLYIRYILINYSRFSIVPEKKA